MLAERHFTLRAETRVACDGGPYAKLAERIGMLLQRDPCIEHLIINGRKHFMLVRWGRDHVHTLKAQPMSTACFPLAKQRTR